MRKSRLRSISEKRKAQIKAKPARRAGIARPTTGAKRKGRTPSETLRIYGPPERRAWIKSLPCAWCSRIMANRSDVRRGGCHNAHTVTGGTGRKADANTIVPLCPPHHYAYDHYRFPFEDSDTRGLVQDMAKGIELDWQAHTLSRTTV